MQDSLHTLLAQDSQYIWPPCTPLQSQVDIPRLVVERAEGSYLYTHQGPIIDGISSWWCKTLGHKPAPVIEAIQAQLEQFEHVIGANTTYPALVELAKKLEAISGKKHVFFASDGSCAVEIALKLVIHMMQLKQDKRDTWITLESSYHGETIATLSVSDVDCYNSPYKGMGLKAHVLKHIPYVSGESDPLWSDCSAIWPMIEAQLEQFVKDSCGIIIEPIVQGAGGMKIYSADFLRRLAAFAKAHDCYLIADEIMTGLGRTGAWLASYHAGVIPDLICMSKSLTAGTMPLSCVLIADEIYQYFKANPDSPFLHSHTYTAHPLGVSAANAAMDMFRAEAVDKKAQALGQLMQGYFNEIVEQTKRLKNVRMLGGIIAGDLIVPEGSNFGRLFARKALSEGALLRPLGNTVYWFPPLNATEETIKHLAEITKRAIHAIF